MLSAICISQQTLSQHVPWNHIGKTLAKTWDICGGRGGKHLFYHYPGTRNLPIPGGEKVLYVSVSRELKQHITMATVTKTSLKKWSCPASNFIELIPSHSIHSSNLGNSFWSWILKDCIEVQKKKKKVVALCIIMFTSSLKHEIRHFKSWCSDGKEMYKNV